MLQFPEEIAINLARDFLHKGDSHSIIYTNKTLEDLKQDKNVIKYDTVI